MDHKDGTIITQLFAQAYASKIGSNPPTYIYRTRALGFLINPEFGILSRDLYADIHTNFDQDYGNQCFIMMLIAQQRTAV
ncbi:MAG: hypothetical protein JO076_00950 [Verrucomicrobia bacterium]|nr:hypothetical protein [Verrucomicrobiota bacterium]